MTHGPDVNYGTVNDADDYMDTRPHNRVWLAAGESDKLVALKDATRRIDRLNFSGTKHDPVQPLQFPRGKDTSVPDDIKFACWEVALALLDGRNPDLDVEQLAVEAQSYSGVRTSYNRKFALEHIRAGIPSATAWNYLLPYLRDYRDVSVVRVD